MAKASYSKPASQVDLEERSKKGYVPPAVLNQGVNPQPSENGFVGGVNPEYQNVADVAFAPLTGEKGAEAELEKAHLADEVDRDSTKTPEGNKESGEEETDGPTASGTRSSSSSSTSGSGGAAPTPPSPPSSGSGSSSSS